MCVCVNVVRQWGASVVVHLALRGLGQLHVLFAHHQVPQLLQHLANVVGVLPLGQHRHSLGVHLQGNEGQMVNGLHLHSAFLTGGHSKRFYIIA